DRGVTPSLGPHVDGGGHLEIRVGELKDEFGPPDGEAVLVREPPAQDVGVVVEAEVCGVEEENLPDLREGALEALTREVDDHVFRGAPHEAGEVGEARDGMEARSLKNVVMLGVGD